MKMIKIGKDGKITYLTKSEMFNALVSKLGYNILALLILSFFLYVTTPLIGVVITLFQALTYATLLTVLKQYWYSTSGQTFLVYSVGYMLLLLSLYYGMIYYAK